MGDNFLKIIFGTMLILFAYILYQFISKKKAKLHTVSYIETKTIFKSGLWFGIGLISIKQLIIKYKLISEYGNLSNYIMYVLLCILGGMVVLIIDKMYDGVFDENGLKTTFTKYSWEQINSYKWSTKGTKYIRNKRVDYIILKVSVSKRFLVFKIDKELALKIDTNDINSIDEYMMARRETQY